MAKPNVLLLQTLLKNKNNIPSSFVDNASSPAPCSPLILTSLLSPLVFCLASSALKVMTWLSHLQSWQYRSSMNQYCMLQDVSRSSTIKYLEGALIRCGQKVPTIFRPRTYTFLSFIRELFRDKIR